MSAELPHFSPDHGGPTGPARIRLIDHWRLFWIAAWVIGGALFLRDWLATGPGLSIHGEALWGRDFVNVYTSGALLLEGRLDLLYEVDAYRAYQSALFDGGLQYHNYSYPPVTLLYTWLLALPPYPIALIVWLAGTGGFFVWAARPYLRDAALPAWVALVAPASIVNIWAGHYGFLIGGLWLAAWTILPKRPLFAGILIGLIIVKPHLAVLAPIVLAWRREWLAFATAGATAVLLCAVSALLFGPGLWVTYLTETAALQASMVDNVGAFFLNLMPTVTPSLVILGLPTSWAVGAQAVVAFAATAMLVLRLPADARQVGLAAGTATLLVLPYAFAYDMTVAGLAGLILFKQALSGANRALAHATGLAALVPAAVILLNDVGMPVAPLLLGFQLFAILHLGGGARRREAVSEEVAAGAAIRPPG